MLDFKKVLFPIDLSETSPLLVDYVRTVAERFGAELHVVNVMREPLASTSGIDMSREELDRIRSGVLAGARAQLEDFAKKHFGGLSKVTTMQLRGDPSDEILNYIQQQGISLVVMGTHGRKGLDKIIFGSVAQRIVQMSPAPVLTINPYRIKLGS
ncbi:MAG: universal stress protein [Thermodesulfobacteriota bacterium]